MALAVLALQAGGVSSAANVIVFDPEIEPWPPGGFATLTAMDSAFTSGPTYAGVFFGTVDGASAAFFCAELNDPIDVYYGEEIDLAVNVLQAAPLHDGIPVVYPPAPNTPLSAKQKCLLAGVYDYFGVANPNGYTANTDSQDLTGTSSAGVGGTATMAGLTDLQATAAQLVMWEIIHEANTGTTAFDPLTPLTNAISLTSGKLQWSNFTDPDGNSFNQTAFVTEFNNIADYAVNTWVCVPEITSPVALIAGGLLFVRRREPRALRLTKAGG
jgi:hypothetical protein